MTDLRTLKAGSGTVATDIFNAVIDAILGGLRFTASNMDSGAATDGQVLTADGAGGASWEAGGGSQPGAARWIGPFPFTFADFDPTYVKVLSLVPTPGDLVLDYLIVVDTAFNDTLDPASLSFYCADPDNSTFELQPQPNLTPVSLTDAMNNQQTITGLTGGGARALSEPILVGDGETNAYFLYLNGNNDGDAGAGRLWLCISTPETPA